MLASGTALGQAVVVAVSPLLTRLFTPEDFGLLAAYGAVLSMLLSVASLRYHLAIPLPKDDRDGFLLLVASLGIVVLVTGVLAAVLALLGPALFTALSAPDLIPHGWILVLGVFGAGAYQALSYWAIRRQAFRPLAVTKVTQGVVLALSQVGIGLVISGPFGLLFGDALGRSAGTGMLARLTFRNLDVTAKTSWNSVKRLLIRYRRFPTYSTVSALLNTGGLQLPALLLLSFHGPQVAGWYALTMRVFGVPMSLLGTSASQVFTSSIAEIARTGQSPRRLYTRTALRLFAIGIPIAGLLALVGPTLFSWVFSAEWSVSGAYARILAPMFLVQFVASPLSQTLNVLERQDIQFGWDAFRLVLVAGTLFAMNALGLDATASVMGLSASLLVAYVVLYLICIKVVSSYGETSISTS